MFYESGLSINVMYGLEPRVEARGGVQALARAWRSRRSSETRFKFARQRSKLAGTIRGSFFVIKGEY